MSDNTNQKPIDERRKCPCGCGNPVNPGRTWAGNGCAKRGKKGRTWSQEDRAEMGQIIRNSDKHKAAVQSQENRDRTSVRFKALWEDPTFRADTMNKSQMGNSRPESKLKRSIAATKMWADTDKKIENRNAMAMAQLRPETKINRDAGWKLFKESPDNMAGLVARARALSEIPEVLEGRSKNMTRLWADPVYRDRVITSMVRVFADTQKPSSLHADVKRSLTSRGIPLTTHISVGHYVIDEANIELKIAVEINGCYWHSCPECGEKGPKSNLGRDKSKRTYLKNHGWTLIEIWEHEWKADPTTCLERIRKAVGYC
ncbi:MAG: DUF559 domain-containing protein [bacterium]